MAALVYFRKTAETELTVEYEFGYPELDRRLVIDKRTLRSRPLTGPEDRWYGGVAAKILRQRRTGTGWPEKGVLAS